MKTAVKMNAKMEAASLGVSSPVEAALATLATDLAASAAALRGGNNRHAKSDALAAVVRFLRAARIAEASMLPLHELHAELADAQKREEGHGARPKPVKATIDQSRALAAIDLLKDTGLSLGDAAHKVATAAPGLGLSAAQLLTLRNNAGKGRERAEMQEERRVILRLVRGNGWAAADAAAILLGFLREHTYVHKKG